MRNPTPAEIRTARRDAGLTQTEAAHLIHSTLRTWQDHESGISKMNMASWELFCIAIGKISADDTMMRYEATL